MLVEDPWARLSTIGCLVLVEDPWAKLSTIRLGKAKGKSLVLVEKAWAILSTA